MSLLYQGYHNPLEIFESISKKIKNFYYVVDDIKTFETLDFLTIAVIRAKENVVNLEEDSEAVKGIMSSLIFIDEYLRKLGDNEYSRRFEQLDNLSIELSLNFFYYLMKHF